MIKLKSILITTGLLLLIVGLWCGVFWIVCRFPIVLAVIMWVAILLALILIWLTIYFKIEGWLNLREWYKKRAEPDQKGAKHDGD